MLDNMSNTMNFRTHKCGNCAYYHTHGRQFQQECHYGFSIPQHADKNAYPSENTLTLYDGHTYPSNCSYTPATREQMEERRKVWMEEIDTIIEETQLPPKMTDEQKSALTVLVETCKRNNGECSKCELNTELCHDKQYVKCCSSRIDNEDMIINGDVIYNAT